MKRKANVRIEIDPAFQNPEIIIRTDQETDFVKKLVSAIEQCEDNDSSRIRVYDGNTTLLLSPQEILRVHTQPRKLIVCTSTDSFEARCTLQSMEELLDPESFVRISRFEIINIEKVSGFDVGASGTIKVLFEDGSYTWVARRYVHTMERKLEQFYGKGGRIDD